MRQTEREEARAGVGVGPINVGDLKQPEKLSSFRIKELNDILTRLGLSKQGRKQDLVDRILDSLSVEASDLQDLAKKNIMHKGEVAGIVDNAFRKLQSMEATSSSMNEESFSEIDHLKPEVVQKTIRCPCGSSFPTEPMIQCADPLCGVLQHMFCVIVPEELSEEITPWKHYCEICRLNRADPFRVTVTHLLPPVKLKTLSIPHDGSNPVQNVEKPFQLSRTDKNFLRHNDYNIQAWCILLDDKVQFRMQWPLYADLKVNGVPVRTVTRPGSQLLGANGRDDGSMIAFYMVDGLNQISLSGWDARSFCLGVRIVKENTVQQILEKILNEQDAESFAAALARVQRCIGGGVAMATEDSDSDLEVISDFVTVNLRCPMGGYRIKTAGRFRPCAHMGCFDLETFLQLNQRSRKWQCPTCLRNYSLEDIAVDPYLNCITKMLEDCEEDVTEIDVKFDGSWRVKKGGGFKNLDQWRNPDGSPCDSTIGTISNSASSRQLEVEGGVEHIDDWRHSKLGGILTTFNHHQREHFESCNKGVIKMSNSSCESHRDGEHSVNHNSDLSNFDTITKTVIGNSSASSNLDIIVLSDSDEETPSLIFPEPVSKPQAANDVGHAVSCPGIPNSFTESLPCDVGRSSSLGIFRCNDNQTFSSSTQEVSKFRPLHTHIVLDASAGPEYTTGTSSPPICGRVLTANSSSDWQFVDSSVCHSNNLVSPQGCDLNSRQIFSHKSPCEPMQSESCLDHQISNGTVRENSTLFGCGSNNGGDYGASRAQSKVLTTGGQDFVEHCEINEDLLVNKRVRLELTTDTEHSNGPFSFPRRARSAKRHYIP